MILYLSFTLLFHTDESYIAYSLPLVLFFFMGDMKLIFKLKKILVFIILTILFSLPWLIRNYIYYGEPVLISIRTTNITNKFIDHSDKILLFDHTPNTLYLTKIQIDSVQKGLLSIYPNTGEPISEEQIKTMKNGKTPYQFSTIDKLRSRFYFLWMPFKFNAHYRITGYAYEGPWSLKHNIANCLSYTIFLPFVLVGLIFLVRKRRWQEFFLFGGIMVYHSFIHVAFIPYTRDRYRYPIDFIIIMLAIYAIIYIYDIFRNRKLNISGKDANF